MTDGFSGSLGAAQVLTCNYEPFIGHNVNYTATQHSADNTEALNHNPLNKTLKWAGATRDCNGSRAVCYMLLFGLNRHLYSLYRRSVIDSDRPVTNSTHVNPMYSSESELCASISQTLPVHRSGQAHSWSALSLSDRRCGRMQRSSPDKHQALNKHCLAPLVLSTSYLTCHVMPRASPKPV